VRILIAGGTSASRRALKLLLQSRPDFELVGEVTNVHDIETQLPARHPNLIVLDGEPAIESLPNLIQSLQRIAPRPALIVLSGQSALKQAALSAGAEAFVSKGDAPRSLLTAMEAIRLRRRHAC
jgi:DNA-binding NarL/FixJ family response regulator